jgi:protein involved in polysaccharide export with SLBB domain
MNWYFRRVGVTALIAGLVVSVAVAQTVLTPELQTQIQALTPEQQTQLQRLTPDQQTKLKALATGGGLGVLPNPASKSSVVRLPTNSTQGANQTNAGGAANTGLPQPGAPLGEAAPAQADEAALADPLVNKREETDFQRFVLKATGQSLRLFGYELFADAGRFNPAQSAAVPSSYVLGPGDELVVQVNGMVEVSDRFVIDRDGRILVPKVGPVHLAGVALRDAERVLSANIGRVYRNFTVTATMGRLRSIEIFVVGQAKKPGKYVVSSLSGLINALFETGGPGINGSLRAIELRRGGKTVSTVDMYAFLSQGDNRGDVPLVTGDIIFIPPARARVAVLGSVHAAAVYEINKGETIGQLLALTGGLPTLAAPQKALLERVDQNRNVARYQEEFSLDTKGQTLALQAADIVTVFAISSQIADVVTLQGNVASPMRYNWRAGMRVADILSDRLSLIPSSYWERVNQGATDANYSRPEVNLDYATIHWLDPVALRTRVIAFNLAKAMARDPAENLELKSGDIITVYAPKDPGIETEGSVALVGEIVGGTKRFVWREGVTVKDIIPSAKWLIESTNYWQRDGLTQPADKAMQAGMTGNGTGTEVTRLRDTFNEINWSYAQVVRRNPLTLKAETLTFNLGHAVLDGSADDNLRLEPGDKIALFSVLEIPVPVETRTQMVTLSGEVAVPGRYQLRVGETLPDLIRRAGGTTANAYVFGTSVVRDSVRQQQQDNLDRTIKKMQDQIQSQAASVGQSALASAGGAESSALQVQVQLAAQKDLLTRVQGFKASGRIALDLDPEKPVLPTIGLQSGDVIAIPQRPSFVGVSGEVFSETALLHRPGATMGEYIQKAGLTHDADADNILLIRADGTVESNGARFTSFTGNSLNSKRLMPGDTVYVPSLVDRRTAYSMFVQGAKDWTSILYQFGLGAVGLKVLRN